MIESPLRFQLVTAVVAVGGALLVADRDAPPPPSGPVLRFADPEIDESSGLVDLGDAVATVNDSGGSPIVFVVDKASGETVGRTTYAEGAVDVEALASGPGGSVWVGDIGDNAHRRVAVSVYRLPALGAGDRAVEAQRYDLAYATGPRDAEALLVHPVTGRVHVVTKGLFGGQVFAAPRRLRPDRVNVLRPVADVGGLVTDGAFLPDGRHAVLRSYSTATFLDADGWEPVGSFPLPEQPQGEGVAVPADGPVDHVLVSTEGALTRVRAVPLPAEVSRALTPPGQPEPEPKPEQPAADRPAADRAAQRRGSVPWAAIAAAGTAVAVLGLGGAGLVRAARRRSRSTR